MAYSAPELLLVGAAQNLVLATSPDTNISPACEGLELEDNDRIYDADGLW